jgi:hypothetical protein
MESENRESSNYEGGQSFNPESPEFLLYKRVINNLLEDSFYENDDERYDAVLEAFNKAADSNPDFVLNLAAYARQEMGLRDISQLLLALSAKDDRFNTYPPESGHQFDTRIRDYTPQIVRRMDEAATVIGIYKNKFESDTLPKGLKKGLSDAINMMADEYTLEKYEMTRREINIYDVFNIVHPKPNEEIENWHGLTAEERSDLFERLMKQELDDYDTEQLQTPSTWESVISEKGNTREAWRSVIQDMGIMAKVRNVRNMLEAGMSGDEIFTEDDREYVQRSKMFPFRLYQAYDAYKSSPEVETDTYVEDFLSESIDQTAENLPDEMERSLVIADTSGSMKSPVSGRSNMECYEIATFFAGVASKSGADVGAFADDFAETDFHHRTPSLERMYDLQELDVGGSTNGYKVFEELTDEQRMYRNVILLTDMQLWNSRRFSDKSFKDAFDRYVEQVNPDVNLYIIDLQSYGDLVTPEKYQNVYNISGWNEKVLDFVSYANRPSEIISEIESYKPLD